MTARFRARQTWTIAKIEMRRAFFSKRALWVYLLALFPAVIFIGHGIEVKVRSERWASRGITQPAVLDSISAGQTEEEVLQRAGKPIYDWKHVNRPRRVRRSDSAAGTTTHNVKPVVARFVRLNVITPTETGDPAARIYEFEVYGPESGQNLALNRPATGSTPCDPNEGPEKAFNGSDSNGTADKWCSRADDKFLQVDLGKPVTVSRFVVEHASAGGEDQEQNTVDFNIQVSTDGKKFTTVADINGTKDATAKGTRRRTMIFYDGKRQVFTEFTDGILVSKSVRPMMNFEEDRQVFAGVFQFYYLRLAIFFGCLGIFMNLFRGEMLDKTLHFWFLAPARREVLLAGKYLAGLIASSVIFGGGAMVAFAAMLWMHDPAEVAAYWQAAGFGHALWYSVAAVLGCVGYGSVFLAAGLLLRNPIVPAAVLLLWEGINGFLPAILQKLSVLYYLQSVCPVPAPMDNGAPALVRLLLAPAAPASRFVSILGLFALTALVLWVASRAVRRIEISYVSE